LEKKKKQNTLKLAKFSIFIKMAKPENMGSKTQAKPRKNRPTLANTRKRTYILEEYKSYVRWAKRMGLAG
jgi:hypothetical protein